MDSYLLFYLFIKLMLLAERVWNFLNSNFSTALAGAFAGAFGAQLIAARAERNRHLLEEIRCTNSAIMLAARITENFLALKKQHVKSLKDNFDNQQTAYNAFRNARAQNSTPPQKPFELQIDFQELRSVWEPIEPLQALLFEKISLTGRPTELVSVLSQCIDQLSLIIEQRNRIIYKCKEGSLTSEQLISTYLGLRTRDGHTDSSYPDCINGISKLTDDCIFFSALLGEDLLHHGQDLVKSFRGKSTRIHKVDFSKAKQDGLFPDPKLYMDWINMISPKS